MSIAAEVPHITLAGTGGGTRGPWALTRDGTPWTFERESQIVARRYAHENASPVLLRQGTDYNIVGISGAASIELTPSAPVLMSDQRLEVYRDTAREQILSIPSTHALNSIQMTQALDRTQRQIQEMQVWLNWLRSAAGGGLKPDFGLSGQAVYVGEQDISTVLTGTGFVYDMGNGTWVHLAGTGTPGPSAADVWRAIGNTGTDADFLTSLQQPLVPPPSGTGWRENHDGTVTQWGRATISGGGGTITLPVALSVTNYRVIPSRDALGIDVAVTLRGPTSFDVLATGAGVRSFDWILEGGAL